MPVSEFHGYMRSLLELKQTRTVAEYTAAFWDRVNRVLDHNSDLSIKCFVPQYVQGLREDIQAAVWARSPSSITMASSLARIKEAEIVKNMPMEAKELDDGFGHGADGITPIGAVTDVFLEPAASVLCGADHGVVAMDASNHAALTPTTYSIECPRGDATVEVFPEFVASEVSEETIDIDAKVSSIIELGTLSSPRYSSLCLNDGIAVLATTVQLDVTSSIKQQAQMLRPSPWPSFVAENKGAAHNDILSSSFLWYLHALFKRVKKWWPHTQCVQKTTRVFSEARITFLDTSGVFNTWFQGETGFLSTELVLVWYIELETVKCNYYTVQPAQIDYLLPPAKPPDSSEGCATMVSCKSCAWVSTRGFKGISLEYSSTELVLKWYNFIARNEYSTASTFCNLIRNCDTYLEYLLLKFASTTEWHCDIMINSQWWILLMEMHSLMRGQFTYAGDQLPVILERYVWSQGQIVVIFSCPCSEQSYRLEERVEVLTFLKVILGNEKEHHEVGKKSQGTIVIHTHNSTIQVFTNPPFAYKNSSLTEMRYTADHRSVPSVSAQLMCGGTIQHLDHILNPEIWALQVTHHLVKAAWQNLWLQHHVGGLSPWDPGGVRMNNLGVIVKLEVPWDPGIHFVIGGAGSWSRRFSRGDKCHVLQQLAISSPDDKGHVLENGIIKNKGRMCMVQDQPTKWRKCLPMAEFWYNSSYHTAIGTSPFQALYKVEPNFGAFPNVTVAEGSSVAETMEDYQIHIAMLRDKLLTAQRCMKKYADDNRTERQFQVGDQVLLKLQPYAQQSVVNRQYPKLSYKYFGPYIVLERIGAVAYKLQLPANAKVHPVFHVSQLKPFTPCYTPVLGELPSVPDLATATTFPERILDRRMVRAGNAAAVQVLIKWHGLGPEQATWEDYYYLKNKFPASTLWTEELIQGGASVTPPHPSPDIESPASTDHGQASSGGTQASVSG